jgi:hypothetical protein
MSAYFLLIGTIEGKTAGEQPGERGKPARKYCSLDFLFRSDRGGVKSLTLYLPEGIDFDRFQIGQDVELPVNVSVDQKGRLSVRMVDRDASARAVGQAARDPSRPGAASSNGSSKVNFGAMGVKDGKDPASPSKSV